MKDINEKQIEEMTSEVKNFKERTRFLFGWDGRSKDEIFATLLLEAGYRKQSDTAREILQYLYEKMGNVSLSDTELVLYLAAQYGAEVKE